MKPQLLKAKFVEKSKSKDEVANFLGISVRSLNSKLAGKSQFRLDEMIKLVEILEIEDPNRIFFGR